MRHLLLALPILLCQVPAAEAQISFGVGIELPGVSIGINMPAYPTLARVPGYPVYYAPQVNANYFFYDGLYWVFQNDNWYSSGWYNGPWRSVGPESVPLYVLRVPVRYYRQPPPYFRDWGRDAPPRWGDKWGREWEQNRAGWDRWNRRSAPAPAPLPTYQRRYSGERYPQERDRQESIRSSQYRYQPRDAETRPHYGASRSADRPGSSRAAPQPPVPHRTPQRQQTQPEQRQPQAQPPQRGSQDQRHQDKNDAPKNKGQDKKADRQDRRDDRKD